MDYKQKLGYMALGAGILALGIIIGQWGTPDIEAQSSGVFDKIICREIEVVDQDGKKAIVLQGNEKVNTVVVYGSNGNKAVELGSNKVYKFGEEIENWVAVLDGETDELAILLAAYDDDTNMFAITHKHGNDAIRLFSRDIADPSYDFKSVVQVLDNQGKKMIELSSHRFANWVDVYNRNQRHDEGVWLDKAVSLGSNRDDVHWMKVRTKNGNFREMGDR